MTIMARFCFAFHGKSQWGLNLLHWLSFVQKFKTRNRLECHEIISTLIPSNILSLKGVFAHCTDNDRWAALYKTESCHLSAKLLVFRWVAKRICWNFEDEFKYLQHWILRDTAEKKFSLKGIRYKRITSELSRIKFYLFYLPTSHIWQIYYWGKKKPFHAFNRTKDQR